MPDERAGATDRRSSERPPPATEGVRSRMRKQAVRDTAPELALRSRLHRLGLRYRVSYPVPGAPRKKIDIAFPPRRVAVAVFGCFWHGCAEHKSRPVSNRT